MTPTPRMIEGVVDRFANVDQRDKRITELELDIRRLTRERDDAQREADRAAEDTNRALSNLRLQLSPLFRALQMVFGELDAAGVADAVVDPLKSSTQAVDGKWDEWKARLGPGCAKVIDVLLLGGQMTVTAIATTGKMGKRQVYVATAKMGQVGILDRNGSKFSLKRS